MDPYAVLGVDPTASDSDIRDAYLRHSKRLHPDQHAEATPEQQVAATQAMQDLNVAYDALRHRDKPPSPPPEPRRPAPPASPRPTYRPPPTKRAGRWITVGRARSWRRRCWRC